MPPEFGQYHNAVGLSMQTMLDYHLQPGMEATASGDGVIGVKLQLMDRGDRDKLWLSPKVAETVGEPGVSSSISLIFQGN